MELQKLLYSMCLEREQIIKEYFSLDPCGTKLSKRKLTLFKRTIYTINRYRERG
jgi:hypothetical protein